MPSRRGGQPPRQGARPAVPRALARAPARPRSTPGPQPEPAEPAALDLASADEQRALLQAADPGTRARTVQQLQRDAGNRSVQMLLAGPAPVQRAPEGSGGAKGGVLSRLPNWMAPFVIPQVISVIPGASAAGAEQQHPHVGALPVPSAEETKALQEANEYFETTPLDPLESADDEWLRHRNAFTDIFQRKAYDLALYTLEQSEEQAKAEVARYGVDKDPRDAVDLREAAGHLAQMQQALLDMLNVNGIALTRGNRATTENIDDLLDEPAKALPAELSYDAAGGALTQADYDGLAEAHRVFPQASAKFRAFRDVYGQRFPVLLGHNQDYGLLAASSGAGTQAYVASEAKQVFDSIADARDELSPEKIWKLPIVVEQTKQLLGVQNGTGANDAVEHKRTEVGFDEGLWKLAWAALQLGVAIVAAEIPGVGTAIAVAIVSGIQLGKDYEDYRFAKAMSGRISLDETKRLAEEKPDLGWLAFDLAALVLDLAGVAMAFRELSKAVEAAEEAAKAVSGGAKAVEAGEHAAESARAAKLSLADVEEIVRAQGETLQKQGKLAEGMTVDIFVERIMTGIRRKVATAGEIAEEQASTLGHVLKGDHPLSKALEAGEPNALVALLTEHGDWKSLVRGLERGGKKHIADALVTQRGELLGQIEKELKGLSKDSKTTVKPMAQGSQESISDVDLQIVGADGGQLLIEGETYMSRRFGENWSSMWRLNFYTEGSRLTRYQDVLSSLKPAARVGLTKRMTAVAERFTFARMLESAGNDTAAIARIEKRAGKLGVDLVELRPMLDMDEAARIARRNTLLQEIDGLEGEFATAQGERKVELAEEISTKQIEANYYTFEANITPSSIKLSGQAGLSTREGYGAALQQLEMIEHILSETGGDVAKAAREYELFKYVERFGGAAQKGGKDSAALAYLRKQASLVNKEQREIMEETAHAFTDPSKIRREGEAYVSDVPQLGGPRTPAVTDEFLDKTFKMFQDEADATLLRLNPDAERRASQIPTVRSTSTPGRAVNNMETAADTGQQIIYRVTDDRYLVADATNQRFYAEGHLEDGGELSLTIRTQDANGRSDVLRGAEQFQAILDKFGGKVQSIRGAWSYGDNLGKFNELTAAGYELEEAALATWTGQQAASAGFRHVEVRSLMGSPGKYTKVDVLFVK